MKGRRRRDDQWDEGPRDGQDAQGDTWSDGGLPEDWTRHRADGPGQPGQPAQPGQWQAFGGGGQGFGAGGYAESGYPGAPPPATSQEAPGAYDASGGSGGNGSYDGYGGPGGHAATGGYGSPGGYGASGGYGAPGGYGASGGYGAPDGYGAPGGYGGSGYGASGYADPGGQGYGYAGPLSGNAGYGGLEQSDGRYQNAGYGQPVQGFGETSAIAQYGRMSPGQVPDLTAVEYAASDWTEAANGGAPGTPRPYGRLSIFTLLEDKAGEFDRLAEQAAEGVRAAEPDTLVYVIHVVPKAPMQRIIYEIYRDRAAFQSHERQPHIQRFIDERKACVLATNIIDLRLKYAKVAALGAPKAPAPSPQTQQSQVPSALESAARAPSFSPHGTGYTEVGNAWSADGGRHSGSAQERWDQTSFQGGRYGETR